MSQYISPGATRLTFQTMIKNYQQLQSKTISFIRGLASSMSSANPGKFLLAQFYMSQVTQVGESISNLISQVNSCINNAVRNQKPQ
ncbi:MAG: hypothetical protein HZB76_07000 [Chlamydiae bacterium]|nr:hypothetical protein [Chlamydiota bacterium]